jgi:hypothetical protein
VTISGKNFGRSSGTVKLGTVSVRADWRSDRVTFEVPSRSVGTLPVTVTPRGGTVSNAVSFTVDPPRTRNSDGDHHGDDGEDDGDNGGSTGGSTGGLSGGVSPTGALGQKHLGMYALYGDMVCTACHNGTKQPAPPAISTEGSGMKPGIACSVCHAPGQRESEKAVFVTQMKATTPEQVDFITYARCDSCHTVVGGGDDD